MAQTTNTDPTEQSRKSAKAVRDFWLNEVDQKHWYVSTDDLDQKIRDRFLSLWEEAQEGALGFWLLTPEDTLSYLILTDQFPRNMFRGTAESFATDPSALAVAKAAIDKGYDKKVPTPERQFFYMPLVHSENLCDQDRAVRLISCRMEETTGNAPHAKAHRAIIRKFGRFPTRNEALGRRSTEAELEWLDSGGYGMELRAVSA